MTAADEVWRLQNDDEAECLIFRQGVQGHTRPSESSMQGTYVFTPSGDLLIGLNSMDPKIIARLLEKGRAKWQDHRTEATVEANWQPLVVAEDFRWEHFLPEDGLVLRRTVRDLPDGAQDARDPRFNIDAVWFTAAEMKQLIPASLEPGQRRQIPRGMLERLACFSLVDNVRGQTLPFHRSELAEDSAIAVTVTAVHGDDVHLQFEGQTVTANDGQWQFQKSYWKPEGVWPRAVSTQLLGTATWDQRRQQFDRFELLAVGHRRGKTKYNNRKGPASTGPIGFVFELAPASFSIAPTYINLYEWEFPGRPAGS